jgi:two-component system response regulator MprA
MARILVAEDSAPLRLLYAIWLEGAGYDVRAASDGREAIEIVERGWIPDAAVLDVEMPLVDGIAVCRYLHARDELIHIVVVSAVEGVLEPARRAGAADVFEKPLSREKLLDALRPRAAAA